MKLLLNEGIEYDIAGECIICTRAILFDYSH